MEPAFKTSNSVLLCANILLTELALTNLGCSHYYELVSCEYIVETVFRFVLCIIFWTRHYVVTVADKLNIKNKLKLITSSRNTIDRTSWSEDAIINWTSGVLLIAMICFRAALPKGDADAAKGKARRTDDGPPDDIQGFIDHPLTAAATAIIGDDQNVSALALAHEYYNLPVIDKNDLKIEDKMNSMYDVVKWVTIFLLY